MIVNMNSIRLARRGNSLIWDYFERNQKEDKIAECNLCNKNISYKTTITNLKQHLKIKHTSDHIEFLTRSTSQLINSVDKKEDSSETHYSSEQEIEYLEEPVQNDCEDVYLISPTTSTDVASEHLIEFKSLGQTPKKQYHRVPSPVQRKQRTKINGNVPKSVESLRRIYFMKKCSNLLLERKKLLREIENQKEEHKLKIMILQKTLNNLNKY